MTWQDMSLEKRRYSSRINNDDCCSLFQLLFFIIPPQAAEENNQMYNDVRKVFPSSLLYVFFTANIMWLTGPCSERPDGWRGSSARWSHPQRFDPCLPPNEDIRNRRQSFYWGSFNSDLRMNYAACYCSFESLFLLFDICVLTAVRGWGGGGLIFIYNFTKSVTPGEEQKDSTHLPLNSFACHFITESQLFCFIFYIDIYSLPRTLRYRTPSLKLKQT
jgi:hypothetical protein